jgi:hypothetical protein
LLYAFVYQRLHPDESIVPGLFFLRQSYAGNFSASIQMGSRKQVLENFAQVKSEFESLLKEGLERLFNLNIPFEQTSNLHVCRYCPYAMICRRESP